MCQFKSPLMRGSAVPGVALIAASGSIALCVDPDASAATPLPLGAVCLLTVAPSPVG